MMRKRIVGVFVTLLACAFAAQAETFDLVICGSSSAGIAAAVEAKRHGLKAVVLSATPRIGGLTTGGLGQTDIGCKEAYGGISREFYRAIKAHYADPANWTWQKPGDYRPGGQSAYARQEDAMWTFEPSAALAVLEGWEKRDGLDIRRGERLDRTPGKVKMEEVEVEGRGRQRKIISLITESGREYCGRMFIDATYEGDLMAAAGCRYAVGREANATYGETVNGIQRAEAHGNQLPEGIDPYVVKGDPSSGLIRGVEPDDARPDGAGDDRVQAYCFRMCLTDVPENRIPFAKPEGYDERDYEILFRFLESSPTAMPQPPGVSAMPNRKTDTNNGGGFFSDYIGANWRWPEASYAERDRIAAEHLRYQRGLMWTCANHPRVPERVRREFSKWGTCRDEFAGERGDGWQDQLYVREARRLVGETVMTERHCRGLAYVARPVAKGAYSMDSHNVRRYVTKEGWVRNEGDVQDWRVERPYDIDYGAIVPRRGECGNLFVPVCLSASHIAYGSIRMEPVFFALGQAAGAAAAVALRSGAAAVQDVDYAALAKVLRDEGQVFGSTTKLPMFFTDDMVLQRGVKFPVWGNDVPGTQVEVSFGDATVRTTADAEGRWSLELPALEASATGRPFTVKGTSTIVLKDVVVGDLWFVAGPETLGGVRKTPGKYPAFPEGIGPLFGSASAPRVASVWWDSYSQLSRRPEMHPWRKGTDGASTPVGVLDATWPGCDIRLFTPAEGRNALHYNGMAHGLVRIPVAGLAWSGAAAQADLDALAAAWRRAWGNAALPFRHLNRMPRRTASFADFDARAKAGERLTVVYFGGSLTWSANASEPNRTGFRGRMSDYLMRKYPEARFTFVDAAIGGTGSKLGIFRLERDVMAHRPDLVFIDFICNDGGECRNIESTCCYEHLLRSIVGAGVPVVQMFFTFKFWAQHGAPYDAPTCHPRLKDYRRLVAAYSTGVGDVYTDALIPAIDDGSIDPDRKAAIEKVWPIDMAHPGDFGYGLFAKAGEIGYERAVAAKLVCRVPEKPVFGTVKDVVRTDPVDGGLPAGWTRQLTYRTSAWYDGLSSRWMGDVAVFSGRNPTPLAVRRKGNFFAVFGEGDGDALGWDLAVDGANAAHFEMKFPAGRLMVFRGKALDGWEAGVSSERTFAITPVPAAPTKPKARPELHVGSICTATIVPDAEMLAETRAADAAASAALKAKRAAANLEKLDHGRGKKGGEVE